jgi:hypothetical protein
VSLAYFVGPIKESKKMIKIIVAIVCLQSAMLFLPPASTIATTQTGRSTFTTREPNLYSPQFYADKLDFEATLVKLPGVNRKKSFWELSYQLYFIPEDKYYEAIKHFPRGPSNPTPDQYPGKMLLAEGHKKKTGLVTVQDRIITLTGVPFKEKIPDAQRTKFAHLMTVYAVKIFDAHLNTTVYKSGIFLANPYKANPQDENQDIARKTIYLSFGVNSDGSLDYAQFPFRMR